jgi:hypothetical protein
MYVDFDEKLSQPSFLNVLTNHHPPVPSHLFCPDAVPTAAFLSPVLPPSLSTRQATSAARDKQAISDSMRAQTMVIDVVWALR